MKITGNSYPENSALKARYKRFFYLSVLEAACINKFF